MTEFSLCVFNLILENTEYILPGSDYDQILAMTTGIKLKDAE